MSTPSGGGEMAVTVGVLSDTRRRALEEICDTFAPAVEGGDGAAGEAFYARTASDLGVAAQIEGLLAATALPADIAAFGQLLDAISAPGFGTGVLEERTDLLHAISESSPEAKLGIRQLRAMTFLFFY